MSLGFDAISALPFATSGPDSDVSVVVKGNNTRISLAFNTFYKGSVGSNDALTELIL